MSHRETPPSADQREQVIAQAIADLTPEEAARFEQLLLRAAKRRLILLAGAILALAVMLAGSAWALYAFATAEPGSSRGWVVLVPPAATGLILFAAGRLARRFQV